MQHHQRETPTHTHTRPRVEEMEQASKHHQPTYFNCFCWSCITIMSFFSRKICVLMSPVDIDSTGSLSAPKPPNILLLLLLLVV